MIEIRVGAGGWAYFKVLGEDPLKVYSKGFEFVELNSTFYSYPSASAVGSWRMKVPQEFEFSVRAPRDLTHKYKLEPVEEAYEAFDRTLAICRILRAKILHLLTPSSMEFSKDKINDIADLLDSVDLVDVQLAWEIRRPFGKGLDSRLIGFIRDMDIIHSVDLSKESLIIDSPIIYSRLFGRGYHNVYQFTDEELIDIDRKIVKGETKKAYLSFHGVRMYKDAARYKTYKEKGEFPPVTNSIGLASLEEVLREDSVFPVSKRELIKKQGWKLIDLTPKRRVHASTLLSKLPSGTYKNIEEVIQSNSF